MTKIKWRLTQVTHQWTFLINIGYFFHTFLILANSSLYMNEPLKGTDCLQKSFDDILILPEKVSFMSRAPLCLQTAIFLTFQNHLLLAENGSAFSIIQSAVFGENSPT